MTDRWTITDSVPLSDGEFEYWRSLDSWELEEAIFLLQGYQIDYTHETVNDAAMRTYPELYERARRAFLVNAIEHPKKTPAGNPCFYASSANWIEWAIDKPGVLHDRWLDVEADDLRPKQRGTARERELYGEALQAYGELMEADPDATAERILTHLKNKPVRWTMTADYLAQFEAKSWEKAIRKAGGIRQLRTEARRNLRA